LFSSFQSNDIFLLFLFKSNNDLFNEKQHNSSTSGSSSSTILGHGLSSNDSDSATPNKLARMDEMEKVRKQFAARLDAPKIKKPMPPTSDLIPSSDSTNKTSLRDAMSNDQIAALKVLSYCQQLDYMKIIQFIDLLIIDN
jgi:hypothetical protein